MEEVRKRLSALRRKVAFAMGLEGAALLAALLAAAVAADFLLDRLFRLERGARAVLLALMLSGLGVSAFRLLVRRLRKVPGEDPLAVAVERRFPELGDRLISALQLSREAEPERYGMSAALVADAVASAEEPLRRIRFGDVLDRARLSKRALLGLAALLLLAGGALASPASASIWLQRNVLLRDVRWPQKTWLEVDPERFPGGVARIVRGDDLVVVARSVGEEHPERVTILFEDSEGEEGRAPMKADRAARLYRHEFRDVSFPLSFHLEGGDEVTETFRIELVEPPEAREVEVRIGFPAYSGREPEAVDLSKGDPEVLLGGFVEIRGRSSKDLESAALVLGEEESSIAAAVAGGRDFSARFEPAKTTLVGVRLRDREGLSNPSLAPRFLVRVGPDREPKVRLTLRGIGPLVVSVAGIPWNARLRDDVKTVEGRLEASRPAVDGEAPAPVAFPIPPERLGGPDATVDGLLELAPLDLAPGTFLRLVAFGRDNAQPEAHEGKSDPVALKVVTIEEFLSEMLRRQQEQRRDFEEQYAREKRLKDRFEALRTAAGRPAGELKDEIETEAREQRQIARRAQTVERAMEQILDEMLNNRVVEPSRIDDLRNRVVRALETLRSSVLEPHAASLDLLAKECAKGALPAEGAEAASRDYDRSIRAMEAVLEAMVRVEGFTEIVEAVRAILRLQGETEAKTRARLLEEMRKIFGPDYTLPEDK